MLMSFVGSIETLMAETGLAKILGSVFGGSEKMLTGIVFSGTIKGLAYLWLVFSHWVARVWQSVALATPTSCT